MARRKKKKGLSNNSIYFQGQSCPIRSAGIQEINHKDVEFLQLFLTEKGKIVPRRITGVCSAKQKLLSRAIKRARNLALLSFSEGHVPVETEEKMSEEILRELKGDDSPLTDETPKDDSQPENEEKNTDEGGE